jgi:hypothetical protein
MQLSDERYVRELRRIDLAMRLIGHEARTGTIRECTGLCDDRIRRLVWQYRGASIRSCVRHRGRSPGTVRRLLGNARLAIEVKIFASIAFMHRLWAVGPASHSAYLLLTIDIAEEFCEAYELHQLCHPDAQLSFEQALCALRGLWTGDEVVGARCHDCGAIVVVNSPMLTEPRCEFCVTPAAGRRSL